MGEVSKHVLTELPAQEEKCWREGSAEITRSQLSQGPRGCSTERRSEDQRNSAFETLSQGWHTEREKFCMDTLLPAMVWLQHMPCSQQHPFGSGKKGGDPEMGY